MYPASEYEETRGHVLPGLPSRALLRVCVGAFLPSGHPPLPRPSRPNLRVTPWGSLDRCPSASASRLRWGSAGRRRPLPPPDPGGVSRCPTQALSTPPLPARRGGAGRGGGRVRPLPSGCSALAPPLPCLPLHAPPRPGRAWLGGHVTPRPGRARRDALGPASGVAGAAGGGGGMERRWVFVLLDVLCVLVGKSRATRVLGEDPAPRRYTPRAPEGWFVGADRGGPWGRATSRTASAPRCQRAPFPASVSPGRPGSPRPLQQEVAAGGAARASLPAAPGRGGDSGGRRSGFGARPRVTRADLHPLSRDRRSQRAHGWSVGVGPPARAGERWRERLGPGLPVNPAPPAARTKPVGRVCGPGWGRGRPEAPSPPFPQGPGNKGRVFALGLCGQWPQNSTLGAGRGPSGLNRPPRTAPSPPPFGVPAPPAGSEGKSLTDWKGQALLLSPRP